MASSNDLKRQLTILNIPAGSDILLFELGKECLNRNILKVDCFIEKDIGQTSIFSLNSLNSLNKFKNHTFAHFMCSNGLSQIRSPPA